MRGEEILNLVKEYTGNDGLAGYSDINDAYETICRRAGMWVVRVRDEDSLTFLDDKTEYDLPMDLIRRLESVWIKDNEDFKEWRRLTEVTEDKFERTVLSFRKEDATDDKGVPLFYRLQGGNGNQLEVTPTPDGTYPGRLQYIGNPTQIDRQVEPVLPEPYHRTIAKLAASTWLERQDSEVLLARGDRLRRQVRETYFGLAFDMSPDRTGVSRPRQRILR